MKLLVLGHSDSDGSHLASKDDGLTWVLQRLVLESTGTPLETVHRRLIAGPTAVAYMERQLDAERPDIVILAISAYGAVVELASTRVRERYGTRAADFVNRQEVRAARLAERLGPRGRRALRVPRRAARRMLGTRPAVSFDDLFECYETLFQRLARREQVHTIILGGLGYSTEIERLNPRFEHLRTTLYPGLRALAERLHFDWTMHEDIAGGPEGKQAYLQPDGIHSNEVSQRLAAEALFPLVLARVR